MIKLVKLGELATFSQGQQIPIPLQNTEKFEGCDTFLRIINYTQNTDDFRYIPKQNPKYLVNKEDIVMVRYGAVGFVGRGLSGVLANNLFKVNYKKELVNGDFLYRVLWSDQVQKQLLNASQSTSMAALNFTSVAKIIIPLPPLDQQKKIASILDAADAYRQKTKALISKYDELTQSLFLDMFGDPVKNEKGWEKVELKNVTTQITDGTHFSPEPQDFGFPYITAKHVKSYGLDFYSKPTYVTEEAHNEIYKRCKPEIGDVLYIKDGATTGLACINTFPGPFSMLSSLALIKPDNKNVNSYFLCYWLNNSKIKNKLLNEYMSGAAIQRYTLTKINSFQLIKPTFTLQNQFAERVQAIEQQKAQAQENLKKAEDLFNSLLQKAFKGELV